MADKEQIVNSKIISNEIEKQLRDREALNELEKKSLDELLKQRDILGEISKLSSKIKIPFDESTKTFGKNVEKLTTQRKIERDILTQKGIILGYEKSLESAALVAISKQKELDNNRGQSRKILNDINKINKSSLFSDIEKREYVKLLEADLKNIKNIGENIKSDLDSQKKSIIDTVKNLNDEINCQEILEETLKDEIENEKTKSAIINSGLDIANKLGGNMASTMIKIAESGNLLMMSTQIFIELLKTGVDNFIAFDKSATQTRKELGLLRGEANGLEQNIKDITIETADLGVSFEDVGRTTKALSVAFTSLVAQDKNLVKTTTLLATQLGISAEESAGVLRTLGGISKGTSSSNTNMLGFAKSMATAAGVPLPNVMHDIATASDDARIYTKGTATELVKAVVEARLLGTTLDKMAATSRQLLDFQTSIENEMEASVMLGKNVNFQRARELAYHKDIIGANKEILRITKQVDFSNMNPMQMEAFAKASGKTVAELQDMIQANENIDWIQKNGTVEQKAQLANLQKMKNMRDDEAKDVGKRAIAEMQRQANQERMVALQNKFNQLMMQLSEPIMDIVGPLLTIATNVLPLMLKSVIPIVGIFKILNGETNIMRQGLSVILSTFRNFGSIGKAITNFILPISKMIMNVVNWGINLVNKILNPILNIFGKILSPIGKMFGLIGNNMSLLGKTLGFFGKFLGPIGLIINAFQFLGGFMKGFSETQGGFFKKLWGGLLSGLSAVVKPIFDLLMWPFKKAWEWIEHKFVGHSPSKLGLGILKGITSIGGMLLDALTLPFRSAFNFVSGLFGGPKIPKPSEMIGSAGAGESGTTSTTKTTATDNTNQQLIQKLDELIGLMKSGGISVNLDGNRVSYFLSKNNTERGGLGATA